MESSQSLPASPPATSPAALAGVRVVEMGQLIAGPFCGKTLGEFGADVIKIEAPEAGDPLRNWRLIKDGTSVWWQVQSRNKRSVALDLRQKEGQAIARQLIAEADVLVENFRPGTLEGWGMSPQELHQLNPGLVMLRISGYGQTGPYRDLPGFGAIGEAMGGLRHLTGEPGRVPVRVGVSIGDTLAALHGAIGVLAALYHRRAHGGPGQVIDVALHEAVFNVMESLIPEYSAFGAVREAAGSALPGIAPSNAYPCHLHLPLRGNRRCRRCGSEWRVPPAQNCAGRIRPCRSRCGSFASRRGGVARNTGRRSGWWWWARRPRVAERADRWAPGAPDRVEP